MQAIKPLTSAEAVLLCQQFRFLVGKTLLSEPTDFFLIEHVVAAPFDEPAKNIFAVRFLQSMNPLESISFYQGTGFDVLLFARSVTEKEIVLYESLQDYLLHERIDLTLDELPSYVI